jgi:hypothetical protein
VGEICVVDSMINQRNYSETKIVFPIEPFLIRSVEEIDDVLVRLDSFDGQPLGFSHWETSVLQL